MITLNPGDLVVDYATPKDLAVLKAAGYRGIARYLWDGWKGMSATEMREILAAGFCLWGIYESTIDRAFQGAAAGTVDGARARALADKIGFHGGIIWTLDTDASAVNAPTVVAYGRAFKAAAKAPQTGAYVDGEVVAAMSGPDEFSPIWRPGAGWWSRLWSSGKWKNTHPWTHVTQLTGKIPGTDHGVVLRSCEGWVGDPIVGPVPRAPGVPAPTLRMSAVSRVRRDERVVELQQVLKFWGFYMVKVDGKFGPLTEVAVKRFQSWLHVPADGVYGPLTANAYKFRLSVLGA